MNPESDKHFHTEWIDRYLSGELTNEELDKFNQRLQSDPTFAREVSLQRTIAEQAQRVGREDLHKQLKSLHRELGFAKEKSRRLPFSFFAIAATITLLLVATFVFYFSYIDKPSSSRTPIASDTNKSVQAKKTQIQFQVTGRDPSMGFSGVATDTTTTILIYPADSTTFAYKFDDTLRLYGNFKTNKLILQYHQRNEQYTLLLDSLAFPLQRYKPIQELHASP